MVIAVIRYPFYSTNNGESNFADDHDMTKQKISDVIHCIVNVEESKKILSLVWVRIFYHQSPLFIL